MIAFPCSRCSRMFQVSEDLARKQIRCSLCGQLNTVPGTQVVLKTVAVGHSEPDDSSLPSTGPAPPSDTAAMPTPTLPGDAGQGPNLDSGDFSFTPGEPSPPTSEEAQGRNPEGTQFWPNENTPPAMPQKAAVANDSPRKFDFLAPPQGPDELGRLGSYRILTVLGVGGMGVVFQAEDTVLKRNIAIKVMLPGMATKPGNRQRFLREAQATAAIEHDHIIPIYQVGEDQNVPYLIMPLLKGETLEDRLKRDPKSPVPEVLRIGAEIAEGLAAAQERGLIHRDIKPSNIWLEGQRSRVKILDFGLARPTKESNQLTQPGMIMGTPAYMAPEQARGNPVDHRSDLFSLGCILYRMCTGEPPFTGADAVAMLMALVMEEPRPIRESNPAIPPALAILVKQLLAKDPAGRPATAQLVAETLEKLRATEGMTPGQLSPQYFRPPPVLPPEPVLGSGDLDIGLTPGEDVLGLGDADIGLQADGGISDTQTPEAADTGVMTSAKPVHWAEGLVGQTLGHYAIDLILGFGFSGVVFQANDIQKGTTVALKVLAPDFPQNDQETQQFIQAMKPRLSLRHPNVLTLFGAGKNREFCWVAREYVEGESLNPMIEKLSTASKIDWRQALRVAVHVARALEVAGRNHLTHHNITPQNILWSRRDRVAKIADLMLADALKGSLLQQMIQENKHLAEYPYLAPEQLEETSYVDDISDLYSLGVVTYTLLTGRPPFQAMSPEETLAQIRKADPVKPSKFQRGIPSEFEWVVLTLLARDRKYRFQNPSELLTYLDQVAHEQDLAV